MKQREHISAVPVYGSTGQCIVLEPPDMRHESYAGTYVVHSRGGLDIWSGVRRGRGLVGTLRNGTTVRSEGNYSRDGDTVWLLVQTDGMRGYVRLDRLSIER